MSERRLERLSGSNGHMASEADSILTVNRSRHKAEAPPSSWYEKYLQPCIAEFVGLIVFAFVGTMVTGYAHEGGPTWLIGIALTHGLTIALLIVGLGHISGGHFNPAVTLGVTLAGGIHPVLAGGYGVSQLMGSMIGAAFTKAILPNTTYLDCSGGTHSIGPGVSVGGAILCEALLTMILVMTVIMSAVDSASKGKALPPLAIGLAVVIGILAGGPVSGASLNPARAFGPAVVAGIWKDHYVWWLGPLTGGLIAGALHSALGSKATCVGRPEPQGARHVTWSWEVLEVCDRETSL
ncbi:aquaporin-8-like isoform X1 [Branchiostoma floridae x Branchiostoma belcheri]